MWKGNTSTNFHVNAQPITTTQITNWLRRLEIRSAAFAASSDLMAGIAVEMGKDLRCDVQAMNVIQIAPRECHRAMGECHQCYLEGISLNVGLYRDRRISAVVPSYQISRSRKFLKRKYFCGNSTASYFYHWAWYWQRRFGGPSGTDLTANKLNRIKNTTEITS